MSEPTAKSDITENGAGSYQVVYSFNNIKQASSPFSSYQGGLKVIRVLNDEGKIMGETIWLLGKLRAEFGR